MVVCVDGSGYYSYVWAGACYKSVTNFFFSVFESWSTLLECLFVLFLVSFLKSQMYQIYVSFDVYHVHIAAKELTPSGQSCVVLCCIVMIQFTQRKRKSFQEFNALILQLRMAAMRSADFPWLKKTNIQVTQFKGKKEKGFNSHQVIIHARVCALLLFSLGDPHQHLTRVIIGIAIDVDSIRHNSNQCCRNMCAHTHAHTHTQTNSIRKLMYSTRLFSHYKWKHNIKKTSTDYIIFQPIKISWFGAEKKNQEIFSILFLCVEKSVKRQASSSMHFIKKQQQTNKQTSPPPPKKQKQKQNKDSYQTVVHCHLIYFPVYLLHQLKQKCSQIFKCKTTAKKKQTRNL